MWLVHFPQAPLEDLSTLNFLHMPVGLELLKRLIMTKTGLVVWTLLGLVSSIKCQDVTESASNRTGKALSVFQVVRFPNAICAGTSSYNGTCYTSTECSTKGGSSSGSCASGFGVCCVFTLGCGGTSNQNCTFFLSSTNQPAGQCGVTICKCSSDICQLRVDFNTFVIAGPNTITTTAVLEVNGGIVSAAGKMAGVATQCQTDTFTITGGGASTPPVICGTNTGQHVYVDASNSCNLINFQLGPTGIGTTIPSRQWSLKISQISCYDTNLAPSGCTQYYYGSTTGMVQSFNYANLYELANQRQQICIRRERNYCRICWSTNIATDFAVSGTTANGFTAGSKCCAYGTLGTTTAQGFDCVMIPGATKLTANKKQLPNTICGKSKGLVTVKSGAASTICSMQTPFQLSFITDSLNYPTQGNKGFKLVYWETTC